MPGEEQAQRCLAELRAYRELLASESGAPIRRPCLPGLGCDLYEATLHLLR